MIRLTNTTSDLISLITAQNGAKVVVSYSDATSTAYTGGTQVTSITSATTTTIASTPAASTVRDVDFINIKNTFAGSHTITVQLSVSATLYVLITVTLLTDESICYTHGSGWCALDANGNRKEVTSSVFSSLAVTGAATVGTTLGVTGNASVGTTAVAGTALGSLGVARAFDVISPSDGSSAAVITLAQAGTTNAYNAGAVFFGSTGCAAADKRSALILARMTASNATTPSGDLSFWTANAATIVERLTISSAGIHTMSAYGAGAATFSAAGVISSVSDERLKIKDGTIADPIPMLMALEPGYYFGKPEANMGPDRQLGFYAQNVRKAIGSEAAPDPQGDKPWGYFDRSVLAVVVESLKLHEQRLSKLEH